MTDYEKLQRIRNIIEKHTGKDCPDVIVGVEEVCQRATNLYRVLVLGDDKVQL